MATSATDVIIAGTDGSCRSLDAIGWAAAEAARRDHALRIVHTVSWLYGTPIDPATGVVPEDVLARGREVLDAAVSFAHDRAPDVSIEKELMVGSAAEVLLERARAAAMVVVGAHGTGLVARLPLGSTALQVVTHTSVPAVVVPAPEFVVWGEVAVGVDGVKEGEPALRFAFEEARLRKARLHAVHVQTHRSSSGPGDMRPPVCDPVVLADEERRALGGSMAAWRDEFPDVEVRWEVVHGRPAQILSGVSARSDLLVVGTRGRGGFAGLRLGSVSHAMLHLAHCPVAVVPSASRQQES